MQKGWPAGQGRGVGPEMGITAGARMRMKLLEFAESGKD
jgi:hypothetical protein